MTMHKTFLRNLDASSHEVSTLLRDNSTGGLKDACKAAGLPVSGTKSDLALRLAALTAPSTPLEEAQENVRMAEYEVEWRTRNYQNSLANIGDQLRHALRDYEEDAKRPTDRASNDVLNRYGVTRQAKNIAMHLNQLPAWLRLDDALDDAHYVERAHTKATHAREIVSLLETRP